MGVDFLSDAIQEETGGLVVLSVGGSFNARGGYRVTSWFAFEMMYEGVYGTEAEILGMTSASIFNSHSLVGNFKFILPTWTSSPESMPRDPPSSADFQDHRRWSSAEDQRAGVVQCGDRPPGPNDSRRSAMARLASRAPTSTAKITPPAYQRHGRRVSGKTESVPPHPRHR